MTSYKTLPPLTTTAAADKSGFNPGNWTNAYDSAQLATLFVPYFELYHLAVTSAQVGSALTIQQNRNRWGGTSIGPGGTTEYHLSGSGWLLTPSREFYILWNYAASGTPPVVTAWFRYDIDIPENRAAAGGGL